MKKQPEVNKQKEETKEKLHPRNKHRSRYDLKSLAETNPALKDHIFVNKYDIETVDFFKAESVKELNRSLLMQHYGIESWDIPPTYLCPPIPGRADYIHNIADLVYRENPSLIKKRNPKLVCLDIGVGSSCIFPIIGNAEYGWSFIASDIDGVALDSSKQIVESNSKIKGAVEFRKQDKSHRIFRGVVTNDEYIDVTICNPPFHASKEEADSAALRKVKNLKGKKAERTQAFGGRSNELWCEGGEMEFISSMIKESKSYGFTTMWFTSLVSRQEHVVRLRQVLDFAGVKMFKVIEMGQGHKQSRILAWSFLTKKQRQVWTETRWK